MYMKVICELVAEGARKSSEEDESDTEHLTFISNNCLRLLRILVPSSACSRN